MFSYFSSSSVKAVRQAEPTDSVANVVTSQASSEAAEAASRTRPIAVDDDEVFEEEPYKWVSKDD